MQDFTSFVKVLLMSTFTGETFVVIQLPSHVQLTETPWAAAHQASLSFTISWSMLKLMSI